MRRIPEAVRIIPIVNMGVGSASGSPSEKEIEVAEGNQTKNMDYYGSFTDEQFLGDFLCDDVEFRFDVYAPVPAGLG
jgi:hypothetical protein